MKLCACGCGKRPGRNTPYAKGHFATITACKRRLRRLKKYAEAKRIEFAITLEDVRNLLTEGTVFFPGRLLGRKDTSRGFTSDNLKVRNAQETE